MNRTQLLIIALFLIPFSSRGQQQLIDSLHNKVMLPNISTEQRIIDLSNLAFVLRNTQPAEAIDLASKAIALGHSLNDKKYLSYAWARMYYCYRTVDSIRPTIEAVDSTMWYAQQSDSRKALGNAYRIAGNYAYANDNNEKAVENLLKALELLEDNTENAPELAHIYYMLSGISAVRDDLEGAEKYARLSVNLAKAGNPDVVCLSGLSISDYFYSKYRRDENRLDFDSAIYYARKTIAGYEQFKGIMKEQFTGGTAALNCASYLWDFNPDTPKDTIFNLLNKSITWATSIKNYAVVANCYGLMSEYVSRDGDDKQAEKLLLSAFDILEKVNAPSSTKYSIASGLLRLAERLGDKDKIIKYQKLEQEFYRKMYNEKEMRTIRALEAQYNHKKKEQELIALKNEAEHNKRILYFSIGIALLSVGALFLLFMYYRLKLSLSKHEKEILETKAKDALLQQQLKEEEARRLALEQELIKQQNKQLQNEVFAGAVQIKHKNEVLQAVRKEISTTHSTGNADKIIRENLQSDDYFDEYKTLIKDNNPDFYNRLQDKAEGKLTDLDLKYSTYICMKIPAKQMANLLHVEYNTVRMNKYRIKQKLRLKKEEDLDKFIQNLNS